MTDQRSSRIPSSRTLIRGKKSTFLYLKMQGVELFVDKQILLGDFAVLEVGVFSVSFRILIKIE